VARFDGFDAFGAAGRAVVFSVGAGLDAVGIDSTVGAGTMIAARPAQGRTGATAARVGTVAGTVLVRMVARGTTERMPATAPWPPDVGAAAWRAATGGSTTVAVPDPMTVVSNARARTRRMERVGEGMSGASPGK